MTKLKKIKFAKNKILNFEKYQNRQDLLRVLLVDDVEYSTDEVDEKINKFMKGVQ